MGCGVESCSSFAQFQFGRRCQFGNEVEVAIEATTGVTRKTHSNGCPCRGRPCDVAREECFQARTEHIRSCSNGCDVAREECFQART